MCLIICDVCDETLSDFSGHICNPEKIKSYVNELKERTIRSERKLDSIQNAIMLVVKSLPTLDGNFVTIEKKLLDDIWNAAQCEWFESKTADSFLTMWLLTHRVMCEAFDVFRSTRFGHKQTLLQKLQYLKESCDEANSALYNNEDGFDCTPEELVNAKTNEANQSF